MKEVPVYKLKDYELSELTLNQLISHAANLEVHPLKDGGRRLKACKLEIIKRVS